MAAKNHPHSHAQPKPLQKIQLLGCSALTSLVYEKTSLGTSQCKSPSKIKASKSLFIRNCALTRNESPSSCTWTQASSRSITMFLPRSVQLITCDYSRISDSQSPSTLIIYTALLASLRIVSSVPTLSTNIICRQNFPQAIVSSFRRLACIEIDLAAILVISPQAISIKMMLQMFNFCRLPKYKESNLLWICPKSSHLVQLCSRKVSIGPCSKTMLPSATKWTSLTLVVSPAKEACRFSSKSLLVLIAAQVLRSFTTCLSLSLSKRTSIPNTRIRF